ncbi:MAG: EAL domain-containing protein [Acidimicrobiales bacterium]
MQHRELGALPSPMGNVLDGVEGALQDVLDELFGGARPALVAVRAALAATSVAVVLTGDELDDPIGGWCDVAGSPPPLTSAVARSLLASLAAARRRPGHRSCGAVVAEPAGGERSSCDGGRSGVAAGTVAVAIELDVRPGSGAGHRHAVLVATGVPAAIAGLGEPLCHLIRACCRSAGVGSGAGGDAALAELSALNELRLWCGALPAAIEERCFTLFRRALDRVHMIFEPVVALDPDAAALRVRSWEALARLRPGDRHAPQELFTTAERWGSRFGVELDATLADRALRQFAAAHRCSPYRYRAPLPVSINVSLRSLWSRTYEQRLAASLRNCGLAPDRVTLELSEKEPLGVPYPLGADDVAPSLSSPSSLPSPSSHGAAPGGFVGHGFGGFDASVAEVDAFRRRLAQLRASLAVRFAIDDLGSGYASFERISQLGDVGVKISRSMLHLQAPLAAITSVLQLTGDERQRRAVIVEGVDDVCPVSLASLYRIGVRNIQGHVTGTGGEELRDLTGPTRRRLAAMLCDAA